MRYSMFSDIALVAWNHHGGNIFTTEIGKHYMVINCIYMVTAWLLHWELVVQAVSCQYVTESCPGSKEYSWNVPEILADGAYLVFRVERIDVPRWENISCKSTEVTEAGSSEQQSQGHLVCLAHTEVLLLPVLKRLIGLRLHLSYSPQPP